MSIASRINEIREHLTNTWDDIDSLGIGIKILPNEYTQVDYIESDGNQYIDTGIKGNQDTKTEIKFEITNLDYTGNKSLVGARVNASSKHYGITLANGQPTASLFSGYNTSSINASIRLSLNTEYEIVKDKNILYLDGTQILEQTYATFETPTNMYIFAMNQEGATFYSSIRLFTLKIYNSNELVRDFIPCYRNSDNEVGLYDLVNNAFYTNQGTGDFTYGSENIEYIDKNLENVDVTLKKLYGTISDKTDMSTNGIKGDTNQETIAAEIGTNVNAKSISISDVDTDKEHYFKLDGDTYQETIQEEAGTSVSNTSIYVSDINTDKENTIELSGNTYQDSTTGKNLLPIRNISKTVNGIAFTINDDGTITANGTATEQIIYPINSNTTGTSANIPVQASTYKTILCGDNVTANSTYFLQTRYTINGTIRYYDSSSNVNLTIDEAQNIGTSLIVRQGQTLTNLILRPMIILSTETDSWEKFTNGPSPSPDYPQNIEVVTGNNNIDICGKNLFDKNSEDIGHVYSSTGSYGTSALWNTSDWIKTSDYITISASTTGSINMLLSEFDNSKTFIQRTQQMSTSKTYNLNINTKYVRLSYKNDIGITNIQIEQGSTATTYEEYQGTTYPVNLGKNLFDKNSAMVLDNYYIGGSGSFIAGDGYHSIYLPCESNTTYTISWGSINPTSQNRCRIASCNTTVTSSSTLTVLFNGTNTQYHSPQTITTPSDAKYIVLDLIASSATTTVSQLMSSIQIEKGSTATDYAPYFEPIELCKIGSYQDRIYNQNDKWYLEKNIGKETDDGSSDEPWGGLNRQINGCYGFRHNGSYSEILLCDKLTNYTATQLYQGIGEGIGYSSAGGYLAVYIKAERVSSYDSAALRAFLSNNPITYYYQLTTPITTEITDTTLVNQLNALHNAQLYPITNINTDTNNLLPYIDLTYNKVTPSPSPERPSNIDIVTGTQNVNVCGKNLFDKDNINVLNAYIGGTSGTITNSNGDKTLYMPVKSNTTYTISKTLSNRFRIGFTDILPTTSQICSPYSLNQDSQTTYTIISGASSKYLVLFYYTTSDTLTEQQILNSIQIEQGSTATPYEQYQGTTYPVNLGNIELCKIDTYQDKIYKQNDKWYLEKKIDKKFENSFTAIIAITSTLANNLYGYACNTQDISSYSELGAIISNIFVPKILGSQTDTTNPNNVRFNMGIAKHPNNKQVIITIDKKYLDTGTTTEFSNFLNNNDFEYYCVLLTPTVTEITDSTLVSQLNALANSTLYATTNINTETSNLLPYIDLQYNVVTPSPSPDRPSEIDTMTGDINYKISGKNLLDISNLYSITTNSGITVSNDVTTGKITLNGTASKDTFITYNTQTFNIGDTLSISANNSITNSSVAIRLYNITTGDITPNILLDETDKVNNNITLSKIVDALQVRIANGTTLNNFILYPQLEKGSTSTSYEPYISRTYQIKLGNIELCKINTYEDKIYSNDGKFYLEKNIGKVVLDGSEDWTLQSINSYGIANFSSVNNINDYIGGAINKGTMCNYFLAQNSLISATKTPGYMLNPGKLLFLRINSSIVNTTETFKTWLSTHNTILYYALATPTTTEITSDNYPELYESLKQIQDYLVQYKINNEFILDYSSPNIEY